MVLGAYEPEVTEVLRREIRPGNICIDVGAHVGYYAILMARLAGQKGVVVAFEPVPVNFEMLQSNIALNALENVRLEPLAVSEGAGGLSLILRSDTELTMNASASGYGVEDRRKVLQVATCSLDGYLARTGIIPDLLLIDVEGAELDVLKGAQATLSKAPPNLLIEIHGWHGPEHDEVSRFLSSFGYQGTILGQRGGEAFAFFRSSNQVMGTPAQEAHSEGSAVSA
jgi:FkbM family methyltransferase